MNEWKKFINTKKNIIFLIIIVIIFATELLTVLKALSFVEMRKGAQLDDPILKLIPSYDVSKILFFLTYTGSIAGIMLAIKTPDTFILTLITYAILLSLRFICMYLTPLDPPLNIIPLRDWVLELTFYQGEPNLKDLFFSGHTATMVMFYIIFKHSKLNYFFLIYSILIAVLLLIQHAHYTIDVFIAPFMAFVSYTLSKKIIIILKNKKLYYVD
ncbi:MAG: sphingomyelin synthase family protein [Bacteroidales bacterium]|nr:sphingomyelin synthase family protein [Bacteroidales bacterium]